MLFQGLERDLRSFGVSVGKDVISRFKLAQLAIFWLSAFNSWKVLLYAQI